MARRFAKVLEEEIEEVFFYPSDLVNTKTTIPLRVGEKPWIYTSTPRVYVYIIQLSPEGEVNSGGYIPRREASRYISTALHRP